MRRETGKMSRKTVSCGGKASKNSGDRFPAAGNGAFSPKNVFRRRITLRALRKPYPTQFVAEQKKLQVETE